MTKQNETIVAAKVVNLIVLLAAMSCKKTTGQNVHPQLSVTPILETETTSSTLPDLIYDSSCPSVENEPGSTSLTEDNLEISFLLDDVAENPNVEIAVLDLYNEKIPFARKCTNSHSAIHLKISSLDSRVKIFLRDTISRKVFTLEDLKLVGGERINLGSIQGTTGGSFKGKIINNSTGQVRGEIIELGWSLETNSEGNWQTGALPAGQWSIILSDQENNTARWKQILMAGKDIEIPAFELMQRQIVFSPLWSGVLTSSMAYFVFQLTDAVEMRISYQANFSNSFWLPFRQVVGVPVPASGRHQIYAQLRTASGEESDIEALEFESEVLDLSSQSDAIIAKSELSVFSPSTTISSVPPEGATHHSVTVDSEELPRTWQTVESPLTLSLQSHVKSCGNHVAYVSFKDALGRETPSLRREFSVSCWERNLPQSPLEARFRHGAAPLAINSPGDAVFIWGGQNNSSQFFSNGAIFKHEGDDVSQDSDGTSTIKPVWSWQLVASSPLSARSDPKIVVGKNHILVFGGIAPDGSVLGDWALSLIHI